MPPLFAILVLLLCLITRRADDPLVIKDPKAAHYVGKNVEVSHTELLAIKRFLERQD
jgi:hypothetical protein